MKTSALIGSIALGLFPSKLRSLGSVAVFSVEPHHFAIHCLSDILDVPMCKKPFVKFLTS
jgi:hypothetical protein